MSFDLFITPVAYDSDAIAAWFAKRANYQVSGGHAAYANDDTGVYFNFKFLKSPELPAGDEDSEPHLAFDLNYCRPHVFGLEAETEVAAFLTRFESRIEDPQAGGMGGGPYSREGFLGSWNAGNRFGFQAVGRNMTPPPPWPAGAALIEAIWKWNLRRASLQAEIGDRIFVPKLRWAVQGANAPVVCAAWTEGVPTLIPHGIATHVLMVRQPRPSLKSLLGAITGKGQGAVELKMVTTGAVRADVDVETIEVDGHAVLHTPQTGAIITPGSWPRAEIRILPPEEVCGADLVALMKKSG